MASILLGISANAQLSGNYTIGGESPDYDSIVNAVADIVTQGVDGPVAFEIRNGLYEEGTIVIDSIPGASSENTITFKSEVGISDSVTIGNDDHIFQLVNAPWVHFEDLSFNCYLTNAKAISFQGGSHGLHVTGCSFELAFQAWGIHRDEPSTGQAAGDTIVIVNNTFNKGKSAIYIKNHGVVFSHYAIVEYNVIDEYYSNAIYLDRFGRTYDDQGNLTNGSFGGASVKNNKIKTSRAVNGTAILLQYVTDDVEVAYNEIYATGTHNQTGLHQSNSNGTISKQLKWYSNFVYVSGQQTTFGLHMQNGSYNQYTNNTVLVDPQGGTSYANYYANAGKHEHLNNLYINLGKSENDWVIRHRAEQDPTNVILASDYNVFYGGGPNFAQWKGDTITSFTQHLDSLMLDGNSTSELVGGFYWNNGQAMYCNGASITGTPVAYVTEDVYGEARDGVNPKIGAIEFSATAQPEIQLTASAHTACGSLTTDVTIEEGVLFNGWYNWSFDEVDLGDGSESDEIQTAESGYVLMEWGFADCAVKDSIELIVHELPEVIFSGDTEFCSGDTANFEVSSTVALDQINWSSGQTTSNHQSTTAETYDVTIRDAATQCSNSSDITISEKEAALPVITDDAGVLTSSIEGESYAWTKDDQILPNDTMRSVEVTSAGTFIVAVSYANECIRSSAPYDATTIVGLESLLDRGFGSIYPNPVSDQLFLDFDFEMNYILTDSKGAITASGYHKTINVDGYLPGIYVLQIFNGTEYIGSTKITVD